MNPVLKGFLEFFVPIEWVKIYSFISSIVLTPGTQVTKQNFIILALYEHRTRWDFQGAESSIIELWETRTATVQNTYAAFQPSPELVGVLTTTLINGPLHHKLVPLLTSALMVNFIALSVQLCCMGKGSLL